MPDRGEIWLADLDPRRGTEPGQRRPVLIVQSQTLDILIDQLRAIDNRRLVRGPLARASRTLLRQIDAAIREVLALAD